MKKRITLVIPPSPFLINDKVFLSLGILYVAGHLRREGWDVDMLDLKGVVDWERQVSNMAGSGDWPVGVSVASADLPIALEILKIVKKQAPHRKVIAGGPHPTISAEDCELFDRVVVGDGVAGIATALDGDEKIVREPMIVDLSLLPRPARDLLDVKSYNYQINGRPATNVMSQFGCPYGCAFCCGRNIAEYRKVRFRTPADFVAELDELNEQYGFTAFMIHDDEFNLNRRRLLEVCGLLSKRDYLFRAFVRSDLFDDEVAGAMKEAGFYQVDAGVESGSDRILGILEKGLVVADNTRAREVARRHGIRFKAFVTIGHPSETEADVLSTRDWLLANKPDDFEMYVISPYPGSKIYDNKENYDLEFDLDFSTDITSITRRYGEDRSLVSNSHMTQEQIAGLRGQIDAEVRKALGLPFREAGGASDGTI